MHQQAPLRQVVSSLTNIFMPPLYGVDSTHAKFFAFPLRFRMVAPTTLYSYKNVVCTSVHTLILFRYGNSQNGWQIHYQTDCGASVYRVLLVFMVLVSSLIYAPTTGASQADVSLNCPAGPTETSVCQTYVVKSGELGGKVDVIQVQINHYPNADQAAKSYHKATVPGYPSGSQAEQIVGVTLGDKYDFYPPAELTSGDMSASYLKVREGNLISLWIAYGPDPNIREALLLSFLSSKRPTTEVTYALNVESYLPELEDLPPGFAMANASETPSNARDASTSTNQKTTRSPRSSSKTQTSRDTPEPTESNQASSSSGPIDILSISGKDAGIGNDTIYVYVEIRNTSGKSLSYIHIDVGCRDANGTVIGTGIANHLGLAPGDTTVLTGLVLDVPNCVTIYARVNPLTN